MENWAQRIHSLLLASGKSQAELARACGIKAGSVSGWFGQGKPTKMISGDNLVAAAQFLESTAEYIMTGRTAATPSQPQRLDAERLAILFDEVDSAARGLAKLSTASKFAIVSALYMDGQVTPDTAEMAARAALNGVLASQRGLHEPTASG